MVEVKKKKCQSHTVFRTYRIGTLRSAGEQDGDDVKGRWQQGAEGVTWTVERGTKRMMGKLT